KAVALAKQLVLALKPSGDLFYDVARVWALAADQTADDADHEKYASGAVVLLRRAQERGYPLRLAAMKEDTAFHALRERQDFTTWLASLKSPDEVRVFAGHKGT